MNINPKTGKIWVNNYLQMHGTVFANKNNKYIQLSRYYDLIGKIEGKTKAGYAMLLHSHISETICNRSPGVHLNVFMYIDNKKGFINNSKEMKVWMLKTGWMDCNAAHLLDIASADVWWIVYKSMLDVGLLSSSAGTLRVMIPINGRFLPLPYAYVAFLSRVKKDSVLSKLIKSTIADTPDKIRTSLLETPKEDLIDEIVRMKTKGLSTSKNSEIYKMLHSEISSQFPAQWGDTGKKVEKNRENFLEKISEKISEKIIENKVENNPEKKSENFSENNSEIMGENFSEDIPGNKTVEEIVDLLPEKISKDKSNKESQKKIRKENDKKLNVEDIHDFIPNKTLKSTKSVSPRNQTTPTNNPDLETQLFFADEVTPNDSNKVLSNVENCTEDLPESIEEILELPTQEYDIFGLPVEDVEREMSEDLESIPEQIPVEETIDQDEFWN